MKHKVGNVNNKEHQDRGGWICGHFMDDGDILKTSNLEVKYSVMQPGETVPSHYHPHGEDIFIIIEGKIRVELDGEEYVLGKNDYVFQQAFSKEKFLEVLEPTIIIAARNPSVPNNKVVE